MEFLLLFVGLFIAFIIDILWWTQKSFQKAEKGFEAHEHYHIGLELVILYIIISHFSDSIFNVITIGAAIGFVLAEWSQSKEIKGVKVVPGHPFALGSSHFKSSTIITIGLSVTAVFIYFYLPVTFS